MSPAPALLPPITFQFPDTHPQLRKANTMVPPPMSDVSATSPLRPRTRSPTTTVPPLHPSKRAQTSIAPDPSSRVGWPKRGSSQIKILLPSFQQRSVNIREGPPNQMAPLPVGSDHHLLSRDKKTGQRASLPFSLVRMSARCRPLQD
jgi:hypothetical protein